MAYTKQTWADRATQYPRRYRVVRDENDPDLVTLIPEPGTVLTEGTRITAGRMNRMEDGISQGIADAKNAMDEAEKGVKKVNSVLPDENGNVDVTVESIGAAPKSHTQAASTIETGGTEGQLLAVGADGKIVANARTISSLGTGVTYSLGEDATLTITTLDPA